MLIAATLLDQQDDGLKALDQQNYPAGAEKSSPNWPRPILKTTPLSSIWRLAEIGLKQDDKAAEHLKQVLVLKPGLYEADLNLGILELRDHKPADAIPALRDAVKQKPTSARAQRYLGDAFWPPTTPLARQRPIALHWLPTRTWQAAELGLGQALLKQKQVADAVPHYRKLRNSTRV